MKIESVTGKSFVLSAVVVCLSLVVTFLREPLSQINNWMLMGFHEGRVTRSVAAADAVVVPKVKLEQIKGASSSSSSSSATGSTTFSKEYSGTPKLTIDMPASGQISKGDVYITKWALVGPFYYSDHPARKDDYCFMEAIDIESVDNESKLDGSQVVSYAKWMNVATTYTNGKVDLKTPFPNAEFAVAYLVTLIDAPEQINDVSLKIGSDDYAKVWVNGEQVVKYNEKCRGGAPDSNTSYPFTLKKGVNTVVFKCVQISGGWEIYARLIDKDGNRLCLKKEASYVK